MYMEGRFGDNSIKNFRLARIRAYRNLGMKELSKKAGISLSYYFLIEHMMRYPPNELRKKISNILKENADYLFPERFRRYCGEHYRETNGISEDVLDRLNRVKFNAKAAGKVLDSEDFLEELENKDNKAYIESLLDNVTLPCIKREIFYSRFGFGGRESRTLEELGEAFHITRARAQQIEVEVIEMLKHHSISKKLRELL